MSIPHPEFGIALYVVSMPFRASAWSVHPAFVQSFRIEAVVWSGSPCLYSVCPASRRLLSAHPIPSQVLMANVDSSAMFIVAVVPASFHRVIFARCRFRRRRRPRFCSLHFSAGRSRPGRSVVVQLMSDPRVPGRQRRLAPPSASSRHAFLRCVRCMMGMGVSEERGRGASSLSSFRYRFSLSLSLSLSIFLSPFILSLSLSLSLPIPLFLSLSLSLVSLLLFPLFPIQLPLSYSVAHLALYSFNWDSVALYSAIFFVFAVAQVVSEQDVLLYYNSRVLHEVLGDVDLWLCG